jgi:hypothetical protein
MLFEPLRLVDPGKADDVCEAAYLSCRVSSVVMISWMMVGLWDGSCSFSHLAVE